MIQPNELKLTLPMVLANNVISSTAKVWEILLASYKGDLATIKKLEKECPELIYAQYNYTPPIHFAVREGYIEIVHFLLKEGAHDPTYKIYPFQENLETIAQDREHDDIAWLLQDYANQPTLQKYKGDNGEILYERTELEKEFERVIDQGNLQRTEEILKEHPEFALDNTFFWSEGILTFAAKENNRPMIDLLISYGAKIPDILKWAQYYYFEHDEGAVYMMEKGMNPNTMSWHHVTLLHDMAQKGNLVKASLLLQYGADIDPIDEEYQSTPLGLATKWGHPEIVELLLAQGADPNKSGAAWSTPIAWAKKKGHAEIEKMLTRAGAA
ncbi:ankyrin repeat domain-containing protein [Terrimonas alba]|uniref:ankyrin repeat domain-containing protein n=1 Tax=Terrimonas alba TaxID=3349636 RepID=UPI0035F4E6F9